MAHAAEARQGVASLPALRPSQGWRSRFRGRTKSSRACPGWYARLSRKA